MSKQTLLLVSESQRKEIREKANVLYADEKKLNNDIDSILEWFSKQQHLPRIQLDRKIIECTLISRKGSVEQTKHKIDMLFSIRNVMPELSSPRDIRNIKIQNALKGCSYATIPKLNYDLTRITIFSYKGDINFFDINNIINYFFMIVDYRLINDYFVGDRYIVDLNDIQLGHLTKLTPTIVKYFEMYIKKAYGIRIFGIHFINGPTFLNSILAIIKEGVSAKLKQRIYVHRTLEELYKVIDKDILPAEYGGKEKTWDEIKESWVAEFDKDEVRNYLVEQSELRSNEDLRIGQKLDGDILGVAGTFRNLDVF